MGMFVGNNGGNDGLSFHSLSAEIDDTVQNSDIEAAPVVRGKWVSSNSGKWQCSVCEEFSFAKIECDDGDLYLETDYCPNCGVKME